MGPIRGCQRWRRMTEFLIGVKMLNICLRWGLESGLVEHEALLSGHGVEHGIQPRLIGNGGDHRLHAALELLLVVAVLRRHGRLSISIRAVKVHSLELLGCGICRGIGHVDKLLLEASLLFGKIMVCRHQFAVEVWVNIVSVMFAFNLHGGRSEDLFRERVHLAGAVHVWLAFGKVGANGGVRDATAERGVLLLSMAVQAESGDVLLELRGWSRQRWEARRLWGGPKTLEHMTAAGPGSRHRVGGLVLVNGVDVVGRPDAQVFDMGAFATRSEARRGHPEAVTEGVLAVVSHLSETACVQTHFLG